MDIDFFPDMSNPRIEIYTIGCDYRKSKLTWTREMLNSKYVMWAGPWKELNIHHVERGSRHFWKAQRLDDCGMHKEGALVILHIGHVCYS